MARIRTIKPEFFTSEDIVSLSPLARLLYIALWCEADRDGRMVWKPRTFKMRYLPADDCEIEALCAEIVGSGLVTLYGDGLACVPKFGAHQHLNPREAASRLPEPDACPTREHASNLDVHAQVGREGKGREGKERERVADAPPPTRGIRLPGNWNPEPVHMAFAEGLGLRNGRATVELEKFRDYWAAQPGQKGVKTDWPATWRNWVRRATEAMPGRPGLAAGIDLDGVH